MESCQPSDRINAGSAADWKVMIDHHEELRAPVEHHRHLCEKELGQTID
jgi:hypothetical protein